MHHGFLICVTGVDNGFLTTITNMVHKFLISITDMDCDYEISNSGMDTGFSCQVLQALIINHCLSSTNIISHGFIGVGIDCGFVIRYSHREWFYY